MPSVKSPMAGLSNLCKDLHDRSGGVYAPTSAAQLERIRRPRVSLWNSARGLATAMDDGICAECKVLQQKALDITTWHINAQSRLAAAKLRYDNPQRRVLALEVEILLQARRAAVRAYQEHVDTHAQSAQVWWC